MVERLLIVVPESEQKATHDVLAELATSGWEQTIYLTGGPSRRGDGPTALLEAERILQLADSIGAGSLIVTKEICVDQKILNKRQDLDVRRPAVGLLRRKLVKDELDLRGLRWR